ncbi:hypothetical protein EVAR_84213_1 [Eumeta japonica]|uniref:Endonuclease/exonuclease/phosphatase domain-containing protein n=1 Tax=Eumeta variegata TaxID=151549 RepID=A0A4C1SAA1_EUMVA|nr:hypothetical protein EVAR_84213_1 [Eumeta japonica]
MQQNEAGYHLDLLLKETRTSSHISSERKGLQNLGTENLIIAGDINAWSHWWGSQREDRRGQAYRDFLDEMGLHPQHRKHSHLRDPIGAIESAVV